MVSSGAGELGGALDGWPDADNALPAADAQLGGLVAFGEHARVSHHGHVGKLVGGHERGDRGQQWWWSRRGCPRTPQPSAQTPPRRGGSVVVGADCGLGAAVGRVVPNIFREHSTQMPLIEDQYAVGEFGSDRAHEPFGETVGPHRRLHPVPTIGIAGCG